MFRHEPLPQESVAGWTGDMEEAEELHLRRGLQRGRNPRADRRYRLQQSGIHILGIFLLVQIGSVVYALVEPERFAYLDRANIETALEAIPLLGIVALGVGMLMIAGEFDLSVGANFIFSSTVVAMLVENDRWSPFAASLVGLAVGTTIGLLNGMITLWFRIPSFITTLGTLGIWSAATLFLHGASSQVFVPTGFYVSLTAKSIWIIPSEFIWLVILATVFWAILQRHRIGNHLFAAGGNSSAAANAGVRVRRAKLFAFACAGFCAALSGILAAARVENISPAGGADLPLQAIAACVIGGLALMGGRGTVLGIVLGTALIYWIQDVLLLLAAPGFYLSAFVGAMIITAGVFYEAVRRQAR
jgi:simple sugar transport system permease protein